MHLFVVCPVDGIRLILWKILKIITIFHNDFSHKFYFNLSLYTEMKKLYPNDSEYLFLHLPHNAVFESRLIAHNLSFPCKSMKNLS